jgi:N-methylhydantoinase B/oxoprolinase/acetone carboxylase alpha subunit
MGGHTKVAINYTKEQVEMMVRAYQEEPTRETVEELAEEFNKSVKSIIGKLSREGVYKKTEYTTKTGEKPVTKLEIVEEMEELLELPYQALAGLEKAPKSVLKTLRRAYESV